MSYLLRKEIKQMLADRVALFTILVTPLILILILGFSLSSWFGSTTTIEGLSIGIIQEMEMSEEAVAASEQLLVSQENLEAMAIPDSLFAYAGNGLSVGYVNDIEQAREENYDVVLSIPAGYRTKMWEQQILGESSSDETFTLYRNPDSNMEAMIIDSMINQSMERLYVETTLAQADQEPLAELGEIHVQGAEPLSSFEYYTYGMSVMYVFFAAGYMANLSYSEKKARVYARLVLANIKPLQYLAVKTLATIAIVSIQMSLLFGICFTLFQVNIVNWPGFLTVALSLCLAVAGVTSLLISIQFRFSTEKVANVFMMFIISILAFLGGSFFRVSDMAPVLGQIGQLTPNGQALQAFIQASQGESIATLSSSILILCGIAVGGFILAWIIFPSKGGVAK